MGMIMNYSDLLKLMPKYKCYIRNYASAPSFYKLMGEPRILRGEGEFERIFLIFFRAIRVSYAFSLALEEAG